MSQLGDYAEDYATLNFKFTTRTTAGVPFVLGGTPVVSVYKANGVAQSTLGVTLTADFDGVTGLNNVLIDLSADAFYAVGNDYQVVITTGTVNGVSVVGEVIAEFSIENRFMRGTDSAALATALATVDTNVDSILVDTAEIGAAGAGLTALATQASVNTIDTNVDAILVDTGTTIPAQISALNDVAATDIVSAGAITTLAGAVVNVDTVDTTTTNTDMRGTDGANTVVPDAAGVAPTTAEIADAVLDEALAGHITVGTLGKAVADIETDAAAILVDTGTTIPGTIATVDANVDAILVDTGTSIPAQISGLNDVAATDIVSAGAITTLAGAVVNVDTVDTTTTNTDMRGTDGANTTTPPTVGAIADQVWDEILSGHLGVGSTGKALSDAGAAGDPWATALPGTYGAGTAGKIIGDNINAPLDTIDANVDAILVDTGTTIPGTIATVDANVDAILVDTGTTIPAQISGLNDVAATDIVSAGAITTLAGAVANVDLVDTTTANTDMRGTDGANTTAPDNASIAAILVDTGTTIPGTIAAVDANVDAILVDTGTTIPAQISALNDLSAAQVNAEADTALVDFFTSSAQLVDDIWDEDVVAAHTTDDTAGEKLASTFTAVGSLATGSAAISVVAESDTVAIGGETNTYEVTDEVDGVHHQITDVAGAMELYYQFDVGGNGVASSVQMTGRLTGANDSIGVYAYNWGTISWDQIGVLTGTNGTSDGVEVFSLLTRHTGTGVNLGKVRIRGYAASGLTSATLYLDQAFVSYAVVAQSVGYDGGQTWIDTVGGTAGTEAYVNGVADNPVLTLADAITIASNVGLHRFLVSNESSITFAEAHAKEVWSGDGWTLALGGQDLSQTHIYHCNDVSGTGTISTGEAHIIDSHIGALTLGTSHLTDCLFSSTFNAGAAANYFIEGGGSGVAGPGSPTMTYSGNGASSNINVRKWSGGGTWVFDADCTASIEVLVGGTHIITTGGGDIEFRGSPKAIVLITSGTGTTNIVVNSGAPISISGTGGIVNIYGMHGGITDTSTGTTVTDGGASVTDLPAVLLDTNDLQTNQSNWLTATGFSTHSAADVRTEMDTNSVDLNSILANQTTIAGLITALNDLSAAQVNAECDTAITDAALATAVALAIVDTNVDAILVDTGTSGVVLTAGERVAIADAMLDRDMATGTDSGSPTVRTVRQALRSGRNKVGIVGGVMTVYAEDDTTASWTAAVTTAAGDPISEVDPV